MLQCYFIVTFAMYQYFIVNSTTLRLTVCYELVYRLTATYKLGGSSALDATARRSRRYCYSRLTCAATQQTHPKAATPSDVTACLSSPRVNRSVLYSQPCIYFQGCSLLLFRSQMVIFGFYRCCVILRCPTTLNPPPYKLNT